MSKWAVATIIAGTITAQCIDFNMTVPGRANPWLAGMPPGSVDNPAETPLYWDSVPEQAPALMPIPVQGGLVFWIRAHGLVCAEGDELIRNQPDGDDRNYSNHRESNGMSGVIASPNRALMGVFLGNDRPDETPAPEGRDYGYGDPGTRAYGARNEHERRPPLKQIFYIGDGLQDYSGTQRIIAPEGATRLFLGIMGGCCWEYGMGSFVVSITFQEPPAQAPPPTGGMTITVSRVILRQQVDPNRAYLLEAAMQPGEWRTVSYPLGSGTGLLEAEVHVNESRRFFRLVPIPTEPPIQPQNSTPAPALTVLK